MSKQLKAARAKVNQFKFGTPEWESAMQVVRTLVAQENASSPREEYRSVDGEIFAPRMVNGRLI